MESGKKKARKQSALFNGAASPLFADKSKEDSDRPHVRKGPGEQSSRC